MSGPSGNPFEAGDASPVRLMADDTPTVVDISYPGGGMQMGFAHPKTALERLDDLDEWLTEALLDPPRLISMPEYVCFTRSVRDRVTQIREQLEDA